MNYQCVWPILCTSVAVAAMTLNHSRLIAAEPEKQCAGLIGLNGWPEWKLADIKPISDGDLVQEKSFIAVLKDLWSTRRSLEAIALVDKEILAHPERQELHFARAILILASVPTQECLMLNFVFGSQERAFPEPPPWIICLTVLREYEMFGADYSKYDVKKPWTASYHPLALRKLGGLLGNWWSHGIYQMAARRAKIDKRWAELFDLEEWESPQNKALRIQFLALCGRRDLLNKSIEAFEGMSEINKKWSKVLEELRVLVLASKNSGSLRMECEKWAIAVQKHIPGVELPELQLPTEVWEIKEPKYENWREATLSDDDWKAAVAQVNQGINAPQAKPTPEQDTENMELFGCFLRQRDFRADVLRRFIAGDTNVIFSMDMVKGHGLRYFGGPPCDIMFHNLRESQVGDVGWSDTVHCGDGWWLKVE